MSVICPVCKGSGNENTTKKVVYCMMCMGTGRIDEEEYKDLMVGIVE